MEVLPLNLNQPVVDEEFDLRTPGLVVHEFVHFPRNSALLQDPLHFRVHEDRGELLVADDLVDFGLGGGVVPPYFALGLPLLLPLQSLLGQRADVRSHRLLLLLRLFIFLLLALLLRPQFVEVLPHDARELRDKVFDLLVPLVLLLRRLGVALHVLYGLHEARVRQAYGEARVLGYLLHEGGRRPLLGVVAGDDPWGFHALLHLVKDEGGLGRTFGLGYRGDHLAVGGELEDFLHLLLLLLLHLFGIGGRLRAALLLLRLLRLVEESTLEPPTELLGLLPLQRCLLFVGLLLSYGGLSHHLLHEGRAIVFLFCNSGSRGLVGGIQLLHLQTLAKNGRRGVGVAVRT
mmetsp:Transcript_20446/g.40892  ORF Transcript_20446/g.40892 Transcript_20446/m.40892 type:complete len:346 (+) Transcript_20446:832-1869(+)